MGHYNEIDKKTGKCNNEIDEKTGNYNETQEETDNLSDRLPIDLSEKNIFSCASAQSDNTAPDHLCWKQLISLPSFIKEG